MKFFAMFSDEQRKKMLKSPSKPVKIVLDTDTKNEIDDQFAIVYALLSSKDIEIEAINAAPFVNQNRGYLDSAVGMEASYQEILMVLDKMNVKDKISVFRGSKNALESVDTPVNSNAATNLIQLAMENRKSPLYVLSIGSITNVISAILKQPDIIERIVVVWLGGHPTYWDWKLGFQIGCDGHRGRAHEFNLDNDPIGAMALFDSGVPLVWIPCKNVAEHLRIVPMEIEKYVRGQGAIGDYLAELFQEWMLEEDPYYDYRKKYSKILWDMAAVAYLINSEWVPTKILPTPKLIFNNLTNLENKNPFGKIGQKRHSCRVALHVNRDQILLDFFDKIKKNSL